MRVPKTKMHLGNMISEALWIDRLGRECLQIATYAIHVKITLNKY